MGHVALLQISLFLARSLCVVPAEVFGDPTSCQAKPRIAPIKWSKPMKASSTG
jgi:hypothetical protein